MRVARVKYAMADSTAIQEARLALFSDPGKQVSISSNKVTMLLQNS